MFWLHRKDSSVCPVIDGHGCFLLEELSPSHNPSYLSLNSQFPDRTGLGWARHEVRNTGEECVWQSPGQLSNVYSVGGWFTHSRWQRSTSQRNIPALSGMGDGLWNVKGERHPTRFWVQLTDPRERDPQASVPKATCSKLSLSLPRGPYPPLLFLVKEQFWSCFLGWHYSSVCPAFSFPGEPSASLTLFYSFIILASEEGRSGCPFYPIYGMPMPKSWQAQNHQSQGREVTSSSWQCLDAGALLISGIVAFGVSAAFWSS